MFVAVVVVVVLSTLISGILAVEEAANSRKVNRSLFALVCACCDNLHHRYNHQSGSFEAQVDSFLLVLLDLLLLLLWAFAMKIIDFKLSQCE